MPNAQLSEQRIDRADLDACSAACVPEVGGCDMVVTIRLQQGQSREALDDLCTGLRCGESLQQFLENQPRRDDDIVAHEGVLQQIDFGFGRRDITAQCERPNAGVDKQRHDRARSAL